MYKVGGAIAQGQHMETSTSLQAMNVALIHKWLATGSSPLAGAGAAEAAACG